MSSSTSIRAAVTSEALLAFSSDIAFADRAAGTATPRAGLPVLDGMVAAGAGVFHDVDVDGRGSGGGSSEDPVLWDGIVAAEAMVCESGVVAGCTETALASGRGGAYVGWAARTSAF
jgi:hypothetical protein